MLYLNMPLVTNKLDINFNYDRTKTINSNTAMYQSCSESCNDVYRLYSYSPMKVQIVAVNTNLIVICLVSMFNIPF